MELVQGIEVVHLSDLELDRRQDWEMVEQWHSQEQAEKNDCILIQ